MAGRFEIFKDKRDGHRFRLKAGNGKIILVSQSYKQLSSCKKGVASVQKNAQIDARYQRRTSNHGKPYFVLRAGNHQVIGNSELYESTNAMENGIESVKKHGNATTVDHLSVPIRVRQTDPVESQIDSPKARKKPGTQPKTRPPKPQILTTEAEVIPPKSITPPTEAEVLPLKSQSISTEAEIKSTNPQTLTTDTEIKPTKPETKPTEPQTEPQEVQINPPDFPTNWGGIVFDDFVIPSDPDN